MCRKGRSTFISLTAVAIYSQKQKQRLVSKLPDRCFRFDFAWLVTLNLVLFRNINLFLLGSCSICRVRGSVEVCQPVAASYDPSTTNDVAKGNRQQGFYEEIEPGQALCCNAVDPTNARGERNITP